MAAPRAKRCSKCHGRGPFYRNRASPDGLTNHCRQCILGRTSGEKKVVAEKVMAWRKTAAGRAYTARLIQRRKRDPKFRTLRTWSDMKRRCGKVVSGSSAYVNVEIRMTLAEFKEWAIPRFSAWFKEHPDLTPSIDRIDSSGHYEPSNIRIISLSDNSRLRARNKNVYAPPGTAWCRGCVAYKPVCDFSKSGSRGGRKTFSGVAYLCKACSKAREP